MDQIISMIAQNFFWTAITLVAICAIVFSSLRSILVGSQRERTRREIAAYIAEGSMTPEQGEKLMKAGKDED